MWTFCTCNIRHTLKERHTNEELITDDGACHSPQAHVRNLAYISHIWQVFHSGYIENPPAFSQFSWWLNGLSINVYSAWLYYFSPHLIIYISQLLRRICCTPVMLSRWYLWLWKPTPALLTYSSLQSTFSQPSLLTVSYLILYLCVPQNYTLGFKRKSVLYEPINRFRYLSVQPNAVIINKHKNWIGGRSLAKWSS